MHLCVGRGIAQWYSCWQGKSCDRGWNKLFSPLSSAFTSALWLWLPEPSHYVTVASSSSERPSLCLCHRSQCKMKSDKIISMAPHWMPLNLLKKVGISAMGPCSVLYNKDLFKRVFDLGRKDLQESGVQGFPGRSAQRNIMCLWSSRVCRWLVTRVFRRWPLTFQKALAGVCPFSPEKAALMSVPERDSVYVCFSVCPWTSWRL